MRRTTRAGLLIGTAGAAMLLALVPAGVEPAGGSGNQPQVCDSTRPASAYFGDGQPASTAGAPVPCLGTTGYGGSETRVVVDYDGSAAGTLFYEPAIITPGIAGTAYLTGVPGPRPSTQLSPGGLASSADGSAWSFLRPAGQTWVPQDDQLYVDRTSGWLYYYALSPDPIPQSGTAPQDQLPAGYAQLMASPDDGKTWYHSAIPGHIESENPRFASAPAPSGGAKPSSGSDVLYWCGNNMLFTPSYRACYRSLDQGISWSFASILFSNPVPQHSLCGTNGENFNAGDGDYPEGAPDGSLYVLVTCGTTTYLARSTDEGATWPILIGTDGRPETVPSDGELRVDPQGNLYLVTQQADALDLYVRPAASDSWLGPQDMTVPGSSGIIQWSMAEAGNGEVAVSYLADTGSTGYDGFLAVTQDALGGAPVFYGTTLDDPSVPVFAGSPPQARDDFIGVDIGPDGTPWASFFGSCSATDKDPGCNGQSGDPEASKAYIGHLAGLPPLP